MDTDYGLPITNMIFKVSAPQKIAYDAELWVDTGDGDWTIRYQRLHPALEGVPKERFGEVVSEMLRDTGHLSLTASIGSDAFYDLAEALDTAAQREAADRLSTLLRRG
jgi:hypothetical protein